MGSNSYEIQVWVNALQNSAIIDMHTMHLIHHLQQHEKKTLSMNVITKHFVKDHPQYKSMSQPPNLQCDVWTCLDTPNTYKQRVLQMGMEQIITRGMRHARQGETGHFSHRLPVCSSSNQAFRSPFSHLGYGWIFLGWKASVESVVLQTFLFLLNLHILPYAFYDLATNTIPTKVVW